MFATVQFAHFHLNFKEELPGGGKRPPIHLLLPTNVSIGFVDLRLLRVTPAAKALYIYIHPCHIWDLKPGYTAQQSTSLTSIPNESGQSLLNCINK
ncbi:hypothetical protein TNCV_930971 [Trichonephila clavipes]|uniref:Uncharacterized protein n=1 Tax=Trichonephila clavipes TaxID=2585209 RepID=A0A8X7BCK1_TRICX|nr:hypothetical protein TNCV_930971 [Trichonephila clavipes]